MTRFDFTGILEWEKIPGWFSLAEATALQCVVKSLASGARVVELGSFQGRSSVAIAAVLPRDGILFCVDHFKGSAEHKKMNLAVDRLARSFLANIAQFGVADRICILQMSTTEAAEKFDAESVDLLLLDASHDFDSVKADLDHWYPKLAPGGFLICDDYELAWPGVMQAIAVSCLNGKLIAPSLWMHRKPELGEPAGTP